MGTMEKILMAYTLKKQSAKVELAENMSNLESALIGLGFNIFCSDAKFHGLPEGISVLGEPGQEASIQRQFDIARVPYKLTYSYKQMSGNRGSTD